MFFKPYPPSLQFLSVPPHIVEFEFNNPMTAGSHATLQCSVDEGDLPVSISWIFHGRELSSQMGIETAKFGRRTNMLSIESVAQSHMGNYTCVATNDAGTTNYTSELLVRGTK